MSFFLVPTVFWSAYDSVTITPIGAYGTEVTGFEIYNAMNSERKDYAPIFSHGEQPIEVTHDDPTPLASLPYTGAAMVWMRWEFKIANEPGGKINHIYLKTGATSGAATSKAINLAYGEAKISTADATYAFYFPDTGSTTTYEGLALYDDQLGDKVWQVVFESDDTDPASNGMEANLYDFMIGHYLEAPDGYVREDISTSEKYFAASQGTRPFGQPIWNGVYASNPRREFTLTFESLPKATRDIWVEVYQYSRGAFPMLWVEDEEDITTWLKVRMTGIEEIMDAEAYTLTIGFEEV